MITKKGVVTKISGEKTVKVETQRYEMHKKYHKKFRISKNYQVHDEEGKAEVGDQVVIGSCRPMSKTKSWKIVTEDQK